ncbi:virulence RhuM family protein [Nitrincola sp. A-D6]|uniref:virulence RhuM family protein n=1 Tax=Nitrincola sp. A-D6 TaxID=1545442 RepID=UPI000AFE0058|nr:RhuM family protein [Nitrincola sp. A-D6]
MSIQQIQIFTSVDGKTELQVAFEKETVWLSQGQMGELFDTSTDNIGLHLKNIYAEDELTEERTTEDFSVVRKEGQRQVRRRIKHYNLDAIISVGYRVSSKRATQFRQWATSVLKEHLVQGYTLNQRRLQERGIEFEQAVSLLSRTLTNQQLVLPEGVAVATVISDYARSWSLLQGYDEQHLAEIGIKQPDMRSLHLDQAVRDCRAQTNPDRQGRGHNVVWPVTRGWIDFSLGDYRARLWLYWWPKAYRIKKS